MAARRRRTSEYHTHSDTAYRSVYDGSAVRVPKREEELQTPLPRKQERISRRKLSRTQVQVRQPGAVAPFAVIGFLAVALLATLLLYSYTENTILSDEVVSLRKELSTLEQEHAILNAQYERMFDMEKIQEAVGDTMVRPTNDQAVYIDLSEPDEVVVYDQESESGLMGVLKNILRKIGKGIEYFR